MVDTVRTIATLLTTLFQDGQAAGSITPQDARDLIVSLSPPEVALTFSASVAWALDTNPVARLVMTGNSTITASGGDNGRAYRLAIVQDATGSRVPTLAGVTLLGTATWLTAPNAINFVNVDVVNGTRVAVVA
jgi:hypothetical protein